MRLTTPLLIPCMLMASILLTASCKKEKAPEPSNLDVNHFIIEDNPNDPIDHAIYEFYKNTGIASYCTDTIYKQKISRENENPPRYKYVTLSLEYTPLSDFYVYTFPLSSRQRIPALLNLLQTEVVPKLPSAKIFPSILFLDSFVTYINSDIQISDGWSSLQGFNTLGVIARDVAPMSASERKMYGASILAGIADKRLTDMKSVPLQKEFFSISREAAKNLFPYDVDIYFGWPFLFIVAPGSEPPPPELGFLYYPTFNLGGMPVPNMLRETDDTRSFLTASFYYTEQEFTTLHANEPLVLKKFGIIRSFAKEVGFKIPE